MTSNITTTTDNNKLVLLWSRCSSYDVVDFTSSADVNANKDIITTTIQSYEIVGRSFFSGRNLENIITNMENDPLALAVWVSKELDKIIISKQKKKRSRKN